MGHAIGVICDARSGGNIAKDQLGRLAEHCSLGVERVPMSRQVGPRDLTAYRAVRRFVLNNNAEILHGHGAKGGAYARLAARSLKKQKVKTLAIYTPHGGSLHYSPEELMGRIFLHLERSLAPDTDGLIFESTYSAGLYEAKVGPSHCEAFIVPNGLWPHEFYDVVLDIEAADFLFVGELRHLKGVDVMLKALARIQSARPATAFIVGSGPDEASFRRLAKELGLAKVVKFAGAMPARTAFSRGRCLIVPSRAESFPYIVLEAAAAQLPMILTDVGGIPEIVSGTETELCPPGDEVSLEARMTRFLDNPDVFVTQAKMLQKAVAAKFTAARMARSVVDIYERALFFAERK